MIPAVAMTAYIPLFLLFRVVSPDELRHRRLVSRQPQDEMGHWS